MDPIYSKALIVASQFSCLEEMLIIVSMLSVESIFYTPREKLEQARIVLKRFSSSEGDHVRFLNVYRSYNMVLESELVNSNEKEVEKELRRWCKENFINSRSVKHACDIHSQILKNVEQMGLPITSCGADMLPLRRCFAASFFLNAAKQIDGVLRDLSTGLPVKIYHSSVLSETNPECVIYDKLVPTTPNNGTGTTQNYIRNVSRIDYTWLAELAPQYYRMK